MLGVSQAATIGLKFTVDYCGFNNYVNYVNAPAFGIPMDQWENLTAMGTGYNACSGTSFFSFNEVIDTVTSSGGLHPLPNGSLTLSWSGSSANWSGFRGYDSSAPPQPITSGPPVPEAQVYAGFIRDGVNFGPGSNMGDNNQPGYSIEITGLKSLFTNTPYAVQLVAASDSMQYLTNAFIIDATLNTTQSVTYPNPQVYGNGGGTAGWFRAIGGGLSTGSGSVNADDLKIIGNRAAHSAGPPAYNFASTISGVIITDKPVITMPPQPVVVSGGDTVKWSGYAVGVPPLSYQWRKNGVAVPGSTNTDFSITNVAFADIANYDLLVTNLYGAATSSVVTVDAILPTPGNNLVLDSNPQGPAHDGLDYGATWSSSNTDSKGTTRTGVMVFNAATPSQIVVPAGTNFNSGTGTVMFWMRSAGVANATNGPAALFDRLLNGNGFALAQNADGTVFLAGKAPVSSSGTVADNNWHHVALTYSSTIGDLLLLYIDGNIDSAQTSAGWTWQAAQEIELGLSHDTNTFQAFNGVLADVRLYNRVLTATEVLSASSGALVDTSALTLRLNFETAPVPGVTFKWRCPDAVLEGSSNVLGPYTALPDALSPYATSVQSAMKFYRYHGHTPTNIVANPFLM